MPKVTELLGRRFGRLTVLARFGVVGGKTWWVTQCDCGAKRLFRGVSLTNGTSRSCGCLAREHTRKRTITHGMTHSPEWATWRRIKHRCTHSPRYVGVRIDPRWAASFEAFYADMGPMPHDRRTIDRIDNARGYEPGNCRWATTEEQNRNKTNNVFVTHGGVTQTVAQWARALGMSQSGLHSRLKRMTVEQALTLPDQRGQRRWRNS